MQVNQNYQGHLTPYCPMPTELIKTFRLLTFQEHLRCRLEAFVFDASDSLDRVPYRFGYFGIYTALGVNIQLQAMRQQLDALINDLNQYTGIN